VQGLNVIKSVIDLKGMKRFKRSDNQTLTDTLSPNDLSMDIMDANHAREIVRKMQTTTQYAHQFGDKPKAMDDFNILKEKQFNKLPISQILKPEARDCLNRWLTIND